MARYWFRPHRYGYGATPSTWEGWAAVAGYSVGLLILAGALDHVGGLKDADKPVWFIGLVLLITAPFLYLCRRKTEGGWRWRWGP